MTVIASIEQKLTDAFLPTHLDVKNESYMHAGPADAETHFKVTIVSEKFNEQRAVARHQAIYAALSTELEGPVHALALHIYTQQEWQNKSETSPESPKCMGASKTT